MNHLRRKREVGVESLLVSSGKSAEHLAVVGCGFLAIVCWSQRLGKAYAFSIEYTELVVVGLAEGIVETLVVEAIVLRVDDVVSASVMPLREKSTKYYLNTTTLGLVYYLVRR